MMLKDKETDDYSTRHYILEITDYIILEKKEEEGLPALRIA